MHWHNFYNIVVSNCGITTTQCIEYYLCIVDMYAQCMFVFHVDLSEGYVIDSLPRNAYYLQCKHTHVILVHRCVCTLWVLLVWFKFAWQPTVLGPLGQLHIHTMIANNITDVLYVWNSKNLTCYMSSCLTYVRILIECNYRMYFLDVVYGNSLGYTLSKVVD